MGIQQTLHVGLLGACCPLKYVLHFSWANFHPFRCVFNLCSFNKVLVDRDGVTMNRNVRGGHRYHWYEMLAELI